MELKLIKNGKQSKLERVFNRKVLPIGSSLAVTMPIDIVRETKIKSGDNVYVYANNDGQIVIDLKPRG